MLCDRSTGVVIRSASDHQLRRRITSFEFETQTKYRCFQQIVAHVKTCSSILKMQYMWSGTEGMERGVLGRASKMSGPSGFLMHVYSLHSLAMLVMYMILCEQTSWWQQGKPLKENEEELSLWECKKKEGKQGRGEKKQQQWQVEPIKWLNIKQNN